MLSKHPLGHCIHFDQIDTYAISLSALHGLLQIASKQHQNLQEWHNQQTNIWYTLEANQTPVGHNHAAEPHQQTLGFTLHRAALNFMLLHFVDIYLLENSLISSNIFSRFSFLLLNNLWFLAFQILQTHANQTTQTFVNTAFSPPNSPSNWEKCVRPSLWNALDIHSQLHILC